MKLEDQNCWLIYNQTLLNGRDNGDVEKSNKETLAKLCMCINHISKKNIIDLTNDEKTLVMGCVNSEHGILEENYARIRDPVLVRCEIDWFEDNYAVDFQLNVTKQKKFDAMKKNPRAQRVYLRDRKWNHILSKVDGTKHPEVADLVKRIHKAANEGITFEMFTNSIGNIYEVITNTIFHALKLGDTSGKVTVLSREPFDKCANILMNGPSPQPRVLKYEDYETYE